MLSWDDHLSMARLLSPSFSRMASVPSPSLFQCRAINVFIAGGVSRFGLTGTAFHSSSHHSLTWFFQCRFRFQHFLRTDVELTSPRVLAALGSHIAPDHGGYRMHSRWTGFLGLTSKSMLFAVFVVNQCLCIRWTKTTEISTCIVFFTLGPPGMALLHVNDHRRLNG